MFGPLTDFIVGSAPSTDFFCFQEVDSSDKPTNLSSMLPDFRSNSFNELSQILPDFNGFFLPTNAVVIEDAKVGEGLAMFSKKGITIDSKGEIIVYRNDNEEKPLERVKNAQYVRFVSNGKNITLCNFHGISYPGDKLDTESRLDQSRRLADFLAGEKGEKVLGGDFNLMPQTESIKMIESSGMKNLIKDFNITSTRSDISYELYKDKDLQHFADFAFVSQGVVVKGFNVPRLNISDHLPLILQFD